MAQLTKLNIQNFGEFGDTEIEFNKITLISNEFPITLIKNMLLSFFNNTIVVDKTELQEYLIKGETLIISLPFTFLQKENLTLKYEYDSNGELLSFKIVDKEKIIPKKGKEQPVMELSKKRIFIDFILLQEWYYTHYIGFKKEKYDKGHHIDYPFGKEKYSVSFNKITELKQKIEEYMLTIGNVFNKHIYEALQAHIKQTRLLLENIETISEQKLLNDIGLIGLNSDAILIEIPKNMVYRHRKHNGDFIQYNIIDKIRDGISDLSKKYPAKNIIITSDDNIMDLLKNRLIKNDVLSESINLYKVITKSLFLIPYFDENQANFKSQNIQLMKKIEELETELDKEREIVNDFNKQLSIATYNEAMLLKYLKLVKSGIILNTKIS